jgi:uncharacterized lipoprotein NlpE involved in copper resistance
MKHITTTLLCSPLLALSACTTSRAPAPERPFDVTQPNVADSPAMADAGHNARNSLDWHGTYEGVLPCADCPGILMRLTLNQNGSYELLIQYLDRQALPSRTRRLFKWHNDGLRIRLDEAGGEQIYFVAEEQLFWLQPDGTRVSGPLAERYVLKRVVK